MRNDPSRKTMNYNFEVFQNQFLIVYRFVHHLTYYRALSDGYKKHQLQNPFWMSTIDAHLLRATLNWCMVFGSDESNPTHWKRLSVTKSEKFQKNFREVLRYLGEGNHFSPHIGRAYTRVVRAILAKVGSSLRRKASQGD